MPELQRNTTKVLMTDLNGIIKSKQDIYYLFGVEG
jgi:hypothetical protein